MEPNYSPRYQRVGGYILPKPASRHSNIVLQSNCKLIKMPMTKCARRKPMPPIMRKEEHKILNPEMHKMDKKSTLHMHGEWMRGASEDSFASVVLFCDVKLKEAKRITAHAERPNQFITYVCINLIAKLASHLGTVGAVLADINQQLIQAIYCPLNDSTTKLNDIANVDSRIEETSDLGDSVTYFMRCQELQKIIASKDVEMNRLQQELNELKIKEKLKNMAFDSASKRFSRPVLEQTMRHWRHYVVERNYITTVLSKVCKSPFTLRRKDVFREWRIAAIGKGYKRESTEYQAMLTVTSDAINHKDAKLVDVQDKLDALRKHYEVQAAELESEVRQRKNAEQQLRVMIRNNSMPTNQLGQDGMRLEIDVYDVKRDDAENSNSATLRVNRLLEDAMFGMARMVETCTLQSAKETIDSIESKEDVSYMYQVLQDIQPYLNTIQTNTNTDEALKAFHERDKVISISKVGIDVFLLKWMCYHLHHSELAKSSAFTSIRNFTTDLQNGKRYSLLLHHLFPEQFCQSKAIELDIDVRLDNIVQFAKCTLHPSLLKLFNIGSIRERNSSSNMLFVSAVYLHYTERLPKYDIPSYRKRLAIALTSWKTVRSLILDIKRRPEDADGQLVAVFMKELIQYDARVQALRKDLRKLCTAIGDHQHITAQMNSKIVAFTWEYTLQQKNISDTIVDERKSEVVAMYARIGQRRIKDVLEAGKEMKHSKNGVSKEELAGKLEILRSTLAEHASDLHDIFRYYSAGPHGGSSSLMSVIEFKRFAKDCKVTGAALSSSMIDYIYHQVLTKHGQKVSSDREMGCKDFVEALIRISEMRFSTAPFKYRLNRLITQHVLLYAERSECDAFRLAVGSEHVSTILRTHKPVLLRIFKSYAVQLENSKSEPYLSLQSFTKFARDCQLLGPRMNLQDLKQLFANIQHVQEDERDQDADSKVDYTEFSEALVALTEFTICNPYLSLGSRTELFIKDFVLAKAKRRKQAKEIIA